MITAVIGIINIVIYIIITVSINVIIITLIIIIAINKVKNKDNNENYCYSYISDVKILSYIVTLLAGHKMEGNLKDQIGFNGEKW